MRSKARHKKAGLLKMGDTILERRKEYHVKYVVWGVGEVFVYVQGSNVPLKYGDAHTVRVK